MKALAVFSGGLDSMVAAQLIRTLGVEVQALFFETPFFSSARARESAAAIDLPLKVIDITETHLEVVKTPKHGRGANMNPCVDCHTLMLSEAGKRLDSEKASFILTGEVLGQRPMSQHKRALALVAAESEFDGLILRPLSARLLPQTLPEQKGWVRREELLDISGRSRKPQMALAKRLGIRDYPAPAGGCLLTDVIFSRRLKDLLSWSPDPRVHEIELLKLGRHFRLSPRTKVIVGRNQKENEAILALRGEEDLLCEAESVPGPSVLASGEISLEVEQFTADLAVSYSDAKGSEGVGVRLTRMGLEKTEARIPRPKSDFKRFMIE